jgi:hypothetical protein
MRSYAKVSVNIWSFDLAGLPTEAKVVGLYLRTCSFATMIGFYYLPFILIGHEIGYGDSVVTLALKTLEAARFAHYDFATEQVYVVGMARQEIAQMLSPHDKRKQLVQSLFERMRGSYLCDLFFADYADYGLNPRPDQNGCSRPSEHEPPSVASKSTSSRDDPKVRDNAEREEAERLLSRYSTSEQGEIAEAFKLLATTRKSGKIANGIILNCLRTWDTMDSRRVMYGIRIYQDRALHLEGKKEPYLKAIMLNATPAQIAKKESGIAPGQNASAISELTQRNVLVFDLLRKEREEDG